MKQIIILIVLIAISLACYILFVQDGIWNDTKTIDGRKDIQVTNSTIPTAFNNLDLNDIKLGGNETV